MFTVFVMVTTNASERKHGRINYYISGGVAPRVITTITITTTAAATNLRSAMCARLLIRPARVIKELSDLINLHRRPRFVEEVCTINYAK